jgi:hypothetical protein
MRNMNAPLNDDEKKVFENLFEEMENPTGRCLKCKKPVTWQGMVPCCVEEAP